MHEQSVESKLRLEALNFWAKHGLAAAIDAYKISRRTLFSWKRLYLDSGGMPVSLNNKSRAQVTRRIRQDWDAGVLVHVIALRHQHPFLGFEKLHIFLLDWCQPRGLSCPSVSTLRRAAKSDKRLCPVKQKIPASQRMKPQGERRPKGYRPTVPGECVGVDTIEIHGSGCYSGLRRYVVTFKDMHSRFALGAALPSKH